MSCPDCEKIQKENQRVYYYRWKNANISFQCCEKHFNEVRDALNAAQDELAAAKVGDKS